jgi:excisionase family DNA binding protein
MSSSAAGHGDSQTAIRGDDLFNVMDAACFLGIRPWTLRHWISDGKIEIVKYGNGIVRIRRSVLDQFVRRRTIKARERNANRSTKKSRLLKRASVGREKESLAR